MPTDEPEHENGDQDRLDRDSYGDPQHDVAGWNAAMQMAFPFGGRRDEKQHYQQGHAQASVSQPRRLGKTPRVRRWRVPSSVASETPQ